ncbi:MAG: S49 family peptidase [Magnetococcales bacterium]|nr:S49 family peptidase [Magnetococcales bacterium]
MVERARLETILSVIGQRIGIDAVGPTTEPPGRTEHQGPIVTPNGISIIPIHGTLAKRVGAVEAASGLTSYALLEEMILDAATDPAVKAILLDIDSPGGEVGGVFDLAAMIREARQGKPVWALADDAFSAAYLLASAAERIYVPQTAGVGSVGVIAVHVDESQRDAQEGRRYTTVFAGARKNDFSSHEPLSGEAHIRLQGEVNRLYEMFVSTVAANRNMTEEEARATEAGLYFGANALAAGLADRVGTLRDALADLSAAIHPPRTTLTIQKEFRMETPIPAAETVIPDLDAIRVESRQQFQHEAQAILDLCTLADAPQLAGDFIARGLDEAQVRKELMARRATGPEIQSQLLPGDGTRIQPAAQLDTNPVVTACRNLATRRAAQGGA